MLACPSNVLLSNGEFGCTLLNESSKHVYDQCPWLRSKGTEQKGHKTTGPQLEVNDLTGPAEVLQRSYRGPLRSQGPRETQEVPKGPLRGPNGIHRGL